MTLPAVRRLSDLVALDRSLLYVFVVGPGRGEGIAIALPTSGWLTVDGATSAVGRPPILEILDTWKAKDDRILWSFLSHPHDDHVDGFADVINTYPPDRIALAGSEGAPRYLDVLKDAPMPNVPDEALKAAKVRTTFSAIRAWETATKQTSFAVNGSTPELKHQGVTIHVRSPSAPAIAAYLTECVKRPSYIKSDANRYSIVLEIVFGASRIVLPGDLPRTVRKKAVSPGWNDLAASAPQLLRFVRGVRASNEVRSGLRA